jgi:hypothetical protein
MASISFNPNKMEFLISFASEDVEQDTAKDNNEREILNLGQTQY